jgi:hypothetical protein
LCPRRSVDFDTKAQQSILETVDKITRASREDGEDHNFTLLSRDGSTGFTCAVSTGARDASFWPDLTKYCKMKKYQTRYRKWVLLALDCEQPEDRRVDFEVFEGEWAADPELERAVQRHSRGKLETAQRTGVRPGRNDPCPCGSGKKYKRCCGR